MFVHAFLVTLGSVVGFAQQEASRSNVAPADVDVTAQPAWKNLQAQIMVQVPCAVAPDELNRYAQLLTLSDAQRAYLNAYYRDYRIRMDDLDRSQGPVLVKLANVLAGFRAPLAEHAHAFERWHAAEEAFCVKIAHEDDRLFTALGMVLAESQQAGFRRVLLQRQRRRCMPEFFDLRKAQVDLIRCMEQDSSFLELTPALSDLLAEYDSALTPALVEADRTYRESRLSLTMANWLSMYDDQDRALDPSTAAGQARIQQANAQLQSVNRRRGVTQTRVAEINDEFLNKLLREVPPQQARQLLACWREQVYPRIYPDPTDPEMTYRQILAIPELGGDVRAALGAMWDGYRVKYRAVCESMEQRSQRWHEHRAFTDNSFGWDEYERTMAAWTRERDALTGTFVKSMIDALPADVRQKAQPFLATWGRSVELEIRKRSLQETPHIDGR